MDTAEEWIAFEDRLEDVSQKQLERTKFWLMKSIQWAAINTERNKTGWAGLGWDEIKQSRQNRKYDCMAHNNAKNSF